ncbi:ABC transporter substrate-binding protein [Mesorhizobium sp. M0119]|uniref:ABC transporter substrate-binding protein n=1 Tax=Mesorhizobium sp. M0119 TaxID=2956885 RepID=UPI003338D52D
MKWGIDREEIVKLIYKGYAVPGNDHPLDPTSKFYNTDMPQRTYDPDKAAFHFKKADLKPGAKVELFTSAAAWSSAVECGQGFSTVIEDGRD